MSAPFCQGVEAQAANEVRTQREIFFTPYFDAPAWTITTTLQPDVRRYLPIGVAALVGNVAAIAFLLALVSSSVVLRRLTRPLDALTSGTRAVLERRLHAQGADCRPAQRVHRPGRLLQRDDRRGGARPCSWCTCSRRWTRPSSGNARLPRWCA
ncbi:MAG: hypothetical protein U5N23_09680 [Acidovorax sp.]|nr:hypothetical protein [Acidovorax sp.]MDZ7863048.1 hypothetical protein [Acidovorax sp.]